MAANSSNDTVNVASEVSSILSKLNDHLAGADEAKEAAAGTSIITLAGENNGATMEVAGDVEVEDLVVVEAGGDEDDDEEEESVVSAYTNSNYQALNNSVLVAGSCAVKDPGVHVVIVEHVDEICDYDDDVRDE
uniref:Uncharacterized protein n=1 Tax=Oryza meridionalis TaxID=40149 RepID=A0A0E0D9X1_9ORYZ